jgi:glycosyltransferase involved in cell wall biosynthesis
VVIRATVIVPAMDAEATLPRTLAALADQEGAPSYEVVVADLGSRDGTAAIAERAGARLVHGGTNAAVASASGALLAFCGADCVPAPGWLAAGSRALAGADLVQGRVQADPRAEAGPFDLAPQVTADSGLYDPASLFMTRALFDEVGRLEIGDLGARARRTAFSAEAVCHRAVVPREPLEYLEERTRLRELPAVVARQPELRHKLLHRHLFLNPRTLKFDLALAALTAAAVRRSTLPLLGVAPYALELRRHARERGGDDWKRVAAIDAAGDLLGAAALVHGSVEARTPVL